METVGALENWQVLGEEQSDHPQAAPVEEQACWGLSLDVKTFCCFLLMLLIHSPVVVVFKSISSNSLLSMITNPQSKGTFSTNGSHLN